MAKSIFGFKPVNFNPKTRKVDMLRSISMKRIREQVSAKLRNKLDIRSNNKCECPWERCSYSKKLEVHHKNMKNDDNRLSNLMLLCPNHHSEMHDKYKRIVKKDAFVIGEVSGKVITSEKAKELKKKKSKGSYPALPKMAIPKFRGF